MFSVLSHQLISSQSLQSSRTLSASFGFPRHFLCSLLPAPTRSVERLSTARHKERILNFWNLGTLKCLNRALDFDSAPLLSKSVGQRVWYEKVRSYLTTENFVLGKSEQKSVPRNYWHWKLHTGKSALIYLYHISPPGSREEHCDCFLNVYTKGKESGGLSIDRHRNIYVADLFIVMIL